jgi:hypothetical protein
MMENGWSEERKKNRKPATLILVTGGERGGPEAKPSANGRFFKLYFIHAASSCNVASDIHVVQVVSIPTS